MGEVWGKQALWVEVEIRAVCLEYNFAACIKMSDVLHLNPVIPLLGLHHTKMLSRAHQDTPQDVHSSICHLYPKEAGNGLKVPQCVCGYIN